jgi:dienelactone hydrolase
MLMPRGPRGARALRRWFALFAAVLVAGASAQSAFRIEVHPIVTLDVGTAQVLAGELKGPERTIAGELRLPFTEQVRVPAVVFLHGDAGALSNQSLWIEALNGIGIAVFTVDSFTGRGHLSATPGIAVEGSLPGSLARTVDAYRALAVLARHPRIDARRIALMGVSSGGRVTINAAMRRFALPLAPAGAGFAAFIALYPPCNLRLVGDGDLVAPLRIHHGAADVVTRPQPCGAYVERLRQAGGDAQFFEYAGAGHGYDGSPRMAPQRNPQVPNASRCEVEERAGGTLVNTATGEPLRPGDACFSRGIEGGPHAEAGAATRARVTAYLRQLFELR